MRLLRLVLVCASLGILTNLTPAGAQPLTPRERSQVAWYWASQQTLAREWYAWQAAHDPHQLCVKAHESDTAGGYRAYDGSGNYGAFQDDLTTWNSAAALSGRPDLIYRDGAQILATPGWDQEQVNWTLFMERGDQPWLGRCPMR